MPKIETNGLSAQFINQNFVRKLEEGRVKEAADEGSRFIRAKMRQDSFAREILEPIELGPDEIDRDEHTDQPKKIIEKEPDSTATFVTFKGTGERTYFKGPRYSVKFGKVESQHFVKSKFELLTYQNDIRKILTDNSVKDMADQEDAKFIETVRAVSTPTAAAATLVGAAHPGAITAKTINLGVKTLLSRKIPVGKLLMTKSRYYDALEMEASVIGNDVASRHYDDGIESEQKRKRGAKLSGEAVLQSDRELARVFLGMFEGTGLKPLVLFSEAALVEQILTEIVDRSPGVTWDAIAGLEG